MRSKEARARTRFAVLIAAIAALAMLAIPAVSAAKDRNHDKIPDRWERRHGLSLKVKQTFRDQDRDQLRNRQEFRAGTDPLDDDSDDDGVEDGDEGAGTVESFNSETGRLVINLFNGDAVAGFVTDDTEIECDNGDDHGDEDEDGEGDGDHSGPGHDGDDDEGDDGPDESGRVAARHDGEDDGPGEDEGDDDKDCDDGHECSVDDLVPGAIVQEAEAKLTGDGLIFEEIELLVTEDA